MQDRVGDGERRGIDDYDDGGGLVDEGGCVVVEGNLKSAAREHY